MFKIFLLQSNCVPTNIDTIEQSTPYSMVQSPPGRTTFRRETNYVSTPIRASNEESVNETSERDSTTFNKSQHSVSNVGQSVATKRKSLFDSPSNREASMRACKLLFIFYFFFNIIAYITKVRTKKLIKHF